MVGSLIFLFWFGLGFLPLHGPGYPETHGVDQANLRLTDSPTTSSVRIKGVHHHAQHLLDVLMFCSSDPKASLPGAFLAALGNHFTNLFCFLLFCLKQKSYCVAPAFNFLCGPRLASHSQVLRDWNAKHCPEKLPF